MRYIYIVLIKAHTGLGSIARRFTHYPYTHIAVCLDKSLTDYISFSRRYHYYPFEAGFTHEYRDYYAFGEHKDFKAKVFRLPVEDDAYGRILSFIEERENGGYLFNVYSMATMPVIGGFRIARAENCMSFTAQVISLSGCIPLKKPYWRYSIKDMDILLSNYELFEGRISKREQDCHPEYMQGFCIKRYLSGMMRLLLPLTKRLIFKK
ncbi:hypothetical protein [uncultured Ruminococcus sp.]|uniref:hypothetical protein n=1 Tax=uncultured Ruminococcus sp. TaxID=165186 RepID=UPI0025EAAB17|nr:hypothetical protein [uncultured Ruminococcus sp.]